MRCAVCIFASGAATEAAWVAKGINPCTNTINLFVVSRTAVHANGEFRKLSTLLKINWDLGFRYTFHEWAILSKPWYIFTFNPQARIQFLSTRTRWLSSIQWALIWKGSEWHSHTSIGTSTKPLINSSPDNWLDLTYSYMLILLILHLPFCTYL